MHVAEELDYGWFGLAVGLLLQLKYHVMATFLRNVSTNYRILPILSSLLVEVGIHRNKMII